MRGDDIYQDAMFSYLPPEVRVPKDSPLRPRRQMVNQALRELSRDFQPMYSSEGRPSIPPEKLLRALLLQVLYTIRRERLLIEQLAGLLSDEHFTVDGTLIEAWASSKSFRPREGPPAPSTGGRNPEVDFRGERRTNANHASTTDP